MAGHRDTTGSGSKAVAALLIALGVRTNSDSADINWLETELERGAIRAQAEVELFWRDEQRISNNGMHVVATLLPLLE